MTAIRDLYKNEGRRIHGEYRILVITREPPSTKGCVRWQLRLSDYSGSLEVGYEPARATTVPLLRPGQIVRAELSIRKANNGAGPIAICSMKQLSVSEIANAARLMPLDRCPKPAVAALHDLIDCVDRLRHDSVRDCANHLIDQHHEGLLRARASWNHHHGFPGGLLVHTVATMKVAESMACHVYPHDRGRVELIMLGALLHDLGKIRTHGGGMRSSLDSVLRHEWLGIELARDALVNFGRAWPMGATEVVNMLEWMCTDPERRKKGPNCDAEIIHFADVLDVKRHHHVDSATGVPRYKALYDLKTSDIL